ncbi:MAG TPA: SDR family NAD(P)-dependent oxidoreductase [Candidatus Acidoferrum sp.]|nr:SDR family NAD(P)-dependent oxidoreductase [Candidatus Acidoferrum sp.]
MADAPLSNRVAIVTGGAGALGGAVTGRLLGDGAQVVVPLELASHADTLRERIAPAARERLFMDVVDVTDFDAMTRFTDGAARLHGRLDILVAIVGGFAGGALIETDRATWDRMLAMNATATFVAARAVVPHMVAAGRGRVVTIGSRAVVPPGPGVIAYTTAKAGVIAFTQALARELQPHGITANCILPSTMDTPANRDAMPDSDRQGWVSVESVADVIAFLVSDAASHVTGALMPV